MVLVLLNPESITEQLGGANNYVSTVTEDDNFKTIAYENVQR